MTTPSIQEHTASVVNFLGISGEVPSTEVIDKVLKLFPQLVDYIAGVQYRMEFLKEEFIPAGANPFEVIARRTANTDDLIIQLANTYKSAQSTLIAEKRQLKANLDVALATITKLEAEVGVVCAKTNTETSQALIAAKNELEIAKADLIIAHAKIETLDAEVAKLEATIEYERAKNEASTADLAAQVTHAVADAKAAAIKLDQSAMSLATATDVDSNKEAEFTKKDLNDAYHAGYSDAKQGIPPQADASEPLKFYTPENDVDTASADGSTTEQLINSKQAVLQVLENEYAKLQFQKQELEVNCDKLQAQKSELEAQIVIKQQELTAIGSIINSEVPNRWEGMSH